MNEMKEITGQKKIVLDLIRNLCPVRTERKLDKENVL